jgi:hypothetical protein
MLVFFTVLQTTTMVPFRIAFFDEESGLMWTVIDIMNDFIFIIDIIITFFVIEEDAQGTAIVSLKGIAKKYIKGYFCFDLISSLPISTVVYIHFHIEAS